MNFEIPLLVLQADPHLNRLYLLQQRCVQEISLLSQKLNNSLFNASPLNSPLANNASFSPEFTHYEKFYQNQAMYGRKSIEQRMAELQQRYYFYQAQLMRLYSPTTA